MKSKGADRQRMGDGKKLPPNYPERIAAGTRFYIGGWDVLFQVVNI